MILKLKLGMVKLKQTSERSDVWLQKQFNKVNVFVCVVYAVSKEYREERINTQRIYSGSPNVG